jgi:NAD(P)-dependent dehydrogenase (short-subunit alcohol dehydrogenase family)
MLHGSTFDGKSVVITGAASGIGRATAELLGSLGARVVVADVSEDAGQATVSAIVSAGGEASFVHCDVTDADSVQAMVDHSVQTYGGLDLAVNNAGIAHAPMDLHELPVEQFDQVIAVDLRGTFLCLRAELAVMVGAGHGVIVNMASNAGTKNAPNMAAYTAAKHGVVGLTKNAALQYARRNIRVNAICPGTILTEGLAAYPEENQKEWGNLMPMGRLGTPLEIAQTIAFLLSDQSSFVTGAMLLADGGLMYA